MSPCVMVRSRDWVAASMPFEASESCSLLALRARAVQGWLARRAAARACPAVSPVAPKKASLLGVVDIVVGGALGRCVWVSKVVWSVSEEWYVVWSEQRMVL